MSKFKKQLLNQLIALSTAGFGLVAALAWNEAIQTFVKEYIAKYFSSGPVLFTKFFYALFITIIAVFITFQLSKLKDKEN